MSKPHRAARPTSMLRAGPGRRGSRSARARRDAGSGEVAHLAGVALLCGIGFTVGLFIGLLAFSGGAAFQDEVKIGILCGSALAGLVGDWCGRRNISFGARGVALTVRSAKRRRRGPPAFGGAARVRC